MKPNLVKQSWPLQASIGTMMLEFNSVSAARAAAAGGAEYAIFDMEHRLERRDDSQSVRRVARHQHGAHGPHSSDRVPLCRPSARHGCRRRHGADGRICRAGGMHVSSSWGSTRLVGRGSAFGISHDDFLRRRLRREDGAQKSWQQILIAQDRNCCGSRKRRSHRGSRRIDVLWISSPTVRVAGSARPVRSSDVRRRRRPRHRRLQRTRQDRRLHDDDAHFGERVAKKRLAMA